jgi:hypothetical protein
MLLAYGKQGIESQASGVRDRRREAERQSGGREFLGMATDSRWRQWCVEPLGAMRMLSS